VQLSLPCHTSLGLQAAHPLCLSTWGDQHHAQGSLVRHTDLCLQAAHPSYLSMTKGRHRTQVSLARHTDLYLRAVHRGRSWAPWFVFFIQQKLALK
jgi:hypothetical protein